MNKCVSGNIRVDALTVQKTIHRYGAEAQQIVAMEECSELIKEISKMLREKGDKRHLTEEIADVLICIENLQQIHLIPDVEIQGVIKRKQERIEQRMIKDE